MFVPSRGHQSQAHTRPAGFPSANSRSETVTASTPTVLPPAQPVQKRSLRNDQAGTPVGDEPDATTSSIQVGCVALSSFNLIKPVRDLDPALLFRAIPRSTFVVDGSPFPLDRMELLLDADWSPDNRTWYHLFREFQSYPDEWFLMIERSYVYGSAWYGRSHSEHRSIDEPYPPCHEGINVLDVKDVGSTLADCAYKPAQ